LFNNRTKEQVAVFQANLERIERSDESAASWVIPLFFAIGGGRLLSGAEQ